MRSKLQSFFVLIMAIAFTCQSTFSQENASIKSERRDSIKENTNLSERQLKLLEKYKNKQEQSTENKEQENLLDDELLSKIEIMTQSYDEDMNLILKTIQEEQKEEQKPSVLLKLLDDEPVKDDSKERQQSIYEQLLEETPQQKVEKSDELSPEEEDMLLDLITNIEGINSQLDEEDRFSDYAVMIANQMVSVPKKYDAIVNNYLLAFEYEDNIDKLVNIFLETKPYVDQVIDQLESAQTISETAYNDVIENDLENRYEKWFRIHILLKESYSMATLLSKSYKPASQLKQLSSTNLLQILALNSSLLDGSLKLQDSMMNKLNE